MSILLYTIIATGLISLISLIGVLSIYLSKEKLSSYLDLLVALSAGTLLGGAFLHIIPEGIESMEPELFLKLLLYGFIVFFLLEKLIHWRHCHDGVCEVHSFGYINLVGDAIHNFLDGVIIAIAFSQNISLGVATTFALALHEIPQELGDFGVLLYAGISKNKALFYNFLISLTSVVGGVLGIVFISKAQDLINYLIPFAGASFLYISTSDLIPRIREEENLKKSLINFLLFTFGIIVMQLLKIFG